MFRDSDSTSPIPDVFFSRLLPETASMEELKVTLFALWRIGHMDGSFPGIMETDFRPDVLGLNLEQVDSGLQAAVRRGSLLKAAHAGHAAYFVNSPQGEAAARTFAQAGWPESSDVSSLPLERPNVFRLYEENIGPLTPLIADALNDAEATYPAGWVADAIDLAVKHNKRSWKYSEAILKRWKEEGRAEKQSGRDDQASRQHDVEDKIKKFVGRAG